MASSDSIIRNTFRQVTGQEIPTSLLRQARNIPDNELSSFFSSGVASGDTAGTTADDFISSVLDDLSKPLDEALSRAGEFERENPFVFDEVLARQSAEERLNPFYETELSDFIRGVNKARGRTIEDEQKLRQELATTTKETSSRIRRNVEETIRSSEEGFAGAGLLSSGARLRKTGLEETEGEESMDSFLRKQRLDTDRSKTREQRRMDDLQQKRQTGLRQSRAAQETALETDVQEQRKDALQRHEFDRQQFVGFPLATGTGSLRSIFGVG